MSKRNKRTAVSIVVDHAKWSAHYGEPVNPADWQLIMAEVGRQFGTSVVAGMSIVDCPQSDGSKAVYAVEYAF